jgi:hypothetical protein
LEKKGREINGEMYKDEGTKGRTQKTKLIKKG